MVNLCGCQHSQEMSKDLQVKGDYSTVMNLHDHACSQHPITTMNAQHQAHEDELIHAIRCVKQKDIVVMLRILSVSITLFIR